MSEPDSSKDIEQKKNTDSDIDKALEEESKAGAEEEIEDPEVEEKKSSRNLIIMIGVIIGIIALIVLLPKLIPEKDLVEESYTYNMFEFRKIGGTWFTMSQEEDKLFELALRYGPKELEDVAVIGSPRAFDYPEVYISVDPSQENQGYIAMANAEVSTKLAQHYGVSPLIACTKDHPDCVTFNATIIDCSKKNETDKGIIVFNNDPDAFRTTVRVDENCVELTGKDENLIKAADRFMLGYYNIMTE